MAVRGALASSRLGNARGDVVGQEDGHLHLETGHQLEVRVLKLGANSPGELPDRLDLGIDEGDLAPESRALELLLAHNLRVKLGSDLDDLPFLHFEGKANRNIGVGAEP